MYAVTALTAMTNVKLNLLLAATPAGMSAMLIFVIFTLLAILTWVQPHLRLATGLIIVVFSLAAIMLTNLGGFIIGTLLGVHGGALMAAWRPRSDSPKPSRLKKARGKPSDRTKPLTRRTPTPLPLPTTSSFDEEPSTAQDRDSADTDAGTSSAESTSDSATEDTTSDSATEDSTSDSATEDTTSGSATEDTTSNSPSSDDTTSKGDDGSEPRTRRVRRNTSSRTLGLVIAVLALTLGVFSGGATPASAATHQAVGDGQLLCEWFPWTCEPSDENPDDGTDSGTDTSEPTAGEETGSEEGTTDSSGVECDILAIPAGFIGTGTDEAATAAEILQACLTDQEEEQEAGLLDTSSQGVESGLPPLGAPMVHLVASRQELSGLAYDGIVTLQTAGGPVDVLKFRADSITITGMKQDVAQPGSRFYLTAGRQATLTGNVVMYVKSQSGRAFGILPLDLSADFPPPLVTSSMVFTDVDSQIVYIRADELVAPQTAITVR
jgi:hypothetical protein